MNRKKIVSNVLFMSFILLFFLSPFIFNFFIKQNSINRWWALPNWNIGEIQVNLVSNQSESRLNEIANRSYKKLQLLDKILNWNKDYSEASKLQKHIDETPKIPFSLEEELFYIINQSYKLSQISDGAFDITVRPLIELWRNSFSKKTLPTKEEINKTLENIGYKNIILNEEYREVSFKKKISMDYGAIAKGYIIDTLVDIFIKNEVNEGLVNIGGDIRVFGSKLWNIAIEDPRVSDANSKQNVIAIIKVKNKSVATSGHYRRYLEIDGKRYSHIIDPRNGQPLNSNNILSVTVIAKNATTADGYATFLCILPINQGLEIAEKNGIDVLFIVKEKNDIKFETTKNFNEIYKISFLN